MRWGRIAGLAIALEAALFAALLPLQPHVSKNVFIAVVTVACAVFAFVAGRLAARRLPSGAGAHGVLVGALATIIYLGVCAAGPGGIPAAAAYYGTGIYVLLNALRIAGCGLGAITVRTKTAPIPSSYPT